MRMSESEGTREWVSEIDIYLERRWWETVRVCRLNKCHNLLIHMCILYLSVKNRDQGIKNAFVTKSVWKMKMNPYPFSKNKEFNNRSWLLV